jgi:glutamyl-tRNA reductase
MHLLLIGISHHTAPVELREKLAVADSELPDTLSSLGRRAGVGEAVVLSTCNRTEIYATCPNLDDGHEALTTFLAESRGLALDDLRPHLYARTHADAARHLFRVAAGLDSLVVGEPQILGQVKQAYATASEQGCTGAFLNRLFHKSFSAGKRVRTETGLADGAVSVSYGAINLARKICGDLRSLTALVVGSGEMAELTARHLQAQQVGRMFVSSRTADHATLLAEHIGGEVVSWEELDRALAAADVVVSATGASEQIISRDRVARAMRRRRTRPLFIIDIAVPRDVDPRAGEIEQVFLYDIDDLRAIVSENLARRGSEVVRAEAVVNEEVEAFVAWTRSRTAMPTLMALRGRFEAVRQAELARLQSKLAHLPPDARARVDDVTRLIVEKLLITPTEQLKALPDRDTLVAYTDALNHLFALDPPDRSDPDAEDDELGGPPNRPKILVRS